MKLLYLGASGLLGTHLVPYLRHSFDVIAPDHFEYDITQINDLIECDIVINSVAYTDVVKAEYDREECFNVNVQGTHKLIKDYPKAKFIYISSEYVYDPVNFYAKTKLWGERMTMMHNNHLIIRTAFKPNPFPYDNAFIDQFTRADYVDIIAPMIALEILKDTTGTVDVMTERKSLFELARRTKPKVKGISVDDIKTVKIPKLC